MMVQCLICGTVYAKVHGCPCPKCGASSYKELKDKREDRGTGDRR